MPKYEYDIVLTKKHEPGSYGFNKNRSDSMEKWAVYEKFLQTQDTVNSIVDDLYPGQSRNLKIEKNIFLSTDGTSLSNKKDLKVFDGVYKEHGTSKADEQIIGFFQMWPASKIQIAMPDGSFHYMTFSNDKYTIEKEAIPGTKEPKRPSLWDRIKSIFTKVPSVEKYNEDMEAYRNYEKEHPDAAKVRETVKQFNKDGAEYAKLQLGIAKRKEKKDKVKAQTVRKESLDKAKQKKAEGAQKKDEEKKKNVEEKKRRDEEKKKRDVEKKAKEKAEKLKKQEEKRAKEAKAAAEKKLKEAAKKKAETNKKNSKGKSVKGATVVKGNTAPVKPLVMAGWTDTATLEQFHDLRARAEAEAPELKQFNDMVEKYSDFSVEGNKKIFEMGVNAANAMWAFKTKDNPKSLHVNDFNSDISEFYTRGAQDFTVGKRVMGLAMIGSFLTMNLDPEKARAQKSTKKCADYAASFAMTPSFKAALVDKNSEFYAEGRLDPQVVKNIVNDNGRTLLERMMNGAKVEAAPKTPATKAPVNTLNKAKQADEPVK